MKLKFKKLDERAVIPAYAKPGDAGLDLTSISYELSRHMNTMTFGTGLSVEIPEGHVGLLFPRSSIVKYHLSLANSVGVIDSGYRGEIKIVMRLSQLESPLGLKSYQLGERVAQLIVIPYPQMEIEEVIELTETERGHGGFGSSGK